MAAGPQRRLSDGNGGGKPMSKPVTLLQDLCSHVLSLGADSINVEHKDGHERVFAQRSGAGFRVAGPLFGCVREIQQLLTNQVVKRALHAEAFLDSLRRLALLDPNLLESDAHSRPIYRRPALARKSPVLVSQLS